VQRTTQDLLAVRKSVVTESYELDTGDKRSCGVCEVEWSTDLGHLQLRVVYDSDGSADHFDWTLDGEKQTDKSWHVLGNECDFHFPHYYHGGRAEDHWREAEDEEVLGRLQETLDGLWFTQTGEQPS